MSAEFFSRKKRAMRKTRPESAAGSGFDAVLVAGGDGTVNEAINGLLSALPSAAAGAGPAGHAECSGARDGLCRGGDLDAAAALLRAGKTRRLDVGR